eukprot:756616-Hanusia_phi.AAC.1
MSNSQVAEQGRLLHLELLLDDLNSPSCSTQSYDKTVRHIIQHTISTWCAKGQTDFRTVKLPHVMNLLNVESLISSPRSVASNHMVALATGRQAGRQTDKSKTRKARKKDRQTDKKSRFDQNLLCPRIRRHQGYFSAALCRDRWKERFCDEVIMNNIWTSNRIHTFVISTRNEDSSCVLSKIEPSQNKLRE